MQLSSFKLPNVSCITWWNEQAGQVKITLKDSRQRHGLLSVKSATRTPFQKQVQRIYAKFWIPYDPLSTKEFLRRLLGSSKKKWHKSPLWTPLLPIRKWLEQGQLKATWECKAMGTPEHEIIAANFPSISSTNSWSNRDQATPNHSKKTLTI